MTGKASSSYSSSHSLRVESFNIKLQQLVSSKEKLCKPISLKAADEILHICAFWRNEIRRRKVATHFTVQPSNPDVHKITNTMKAMTTTLDVWRLPQTLIKLSLGWLNKLIKLKPIFINKKHFNASHFIL
ncbi:CLUMA_CG019824, isoform A [Clunio marinus]|uniref:CLUMA_CG019824, isoform A n=1 Tax=Clunio marinus TaxID=568069 RepID=A0A1J1J7D4_9DIPT|nr:CLUMA_CG019824, isoform A [Clunio marinus]